RTRWRVPSRTRGGGSQGRGQGLAKQLPERRGGLLGRGRGRRRFDGSSERNLHRQRRVVREEARAAGQAEIAHQERGRWGGSAADALQPDPRLDEGGRKSELRSELGVEVVNRVQVRPIRFRKAVRPEAFETVELAVQQMDAHSTVSMTLPASCLKADSARRQDSSSRVTT